MTVVVVDMLFLIIVAYASCFPPCSPSYHGKDGAYDAQHGNSQVEMNMSDTPIRSNDKTSGGNIVQ